MSKWEKRAKEIIDNEKKKHTAVYDLSKNLYEKIHGFHPVDVNLLRKEIVEICDNANLIDSEVVNIDFKPRYEGSNEEYDQVIRINIKGDFNGYIRHETCGGTTNTKEGKIPIFYAWSNREEVVSLKEEKLKDYYKQFKHETVEKLIDLTLENKYYITYDDCYKNYEIWHKKPSQYGSVIKGELKCFDEKKNKYKYKSKYESIKKLSECDNLKEFAEENLYANHESITYEWIEYKL